MSGKLNEAKVLFQDAMVYLKGFEVQPKKNRVSNVFLYIDSETGLTRFRGRIHKSSFSEEAKYPVILPSPEQIRRLANPGWS